MSRARAPRRPVPRSLSIESSVGARQVVINAFSDRAQRPSTLCVSRVIGSPELWLQDDTGYSALVEPEPELARRLHKLLEALKGVSDLLLQRATATAPGRTP